MRRGMYAAANDTELAFGPPDATQRGGCVGERTSSGVNETRHVRRGERYGACEDDEQGVSRILTINLNDVEKQLNIR